MIVEENQISLDSQPVQMQIQSKLRAIWADVLDDDPSSFAGEDVFFEVGGDSISAQRLIEAAAKQDIHLTLEQIFMHASLEDMAEIAQLAKPANPGPSVPRDGALDLEQHYDEIAKACHLSVTSIESAYGLTPMQESLLAAEVTDNDHVNAYVRQFVFLLGPGIDLRGFRDAWHKTIRADAVLRTRICRLQGRHMAQVVVRADAECVLWTTVGGSLACFLAQDARTPMITGDPFFRYTLIEEEAGELYFVWTAHHALFDGASVPEVLSDVTRRLRGEDVPERPPFSWFVHSPAVRPDPTRERQFWTETLSGVHPTSYPPTPPVEKPDEELHARPNARLEHELTLSRLPPFGTTKSLLLRAAWAILLAHYTGTEEVVFGAINNGRTAASATVPGVSRMTGPTINVVPVALQVDPGQTVAALLAHIREQAAQMMAFEHTGLSRIRTFRAASDQGMLDIQSLLVVHHASLNETMAASLQDVDLTYQDDLGKKEQHAYPLILSCILQGDAGIHLRLEYDERWIPTPQARHLAHHLQTVLDQLSEATQDTLLGSISQLSSHDLQQIRQWNASTPPAEETCLHWLFARQVHLRPHATAVCTVEQSLTYAEVDAYSSSLAAQLVEQGVQPGVFVGVCFEKSLWTVVAILAVFKAGGVYVPLDPAHPRGRIEEIVHTVHIQVVLASSVGRNTLQGIPGLSILCVQEAPDHRPWTEPAKPAQPSDTAYLLFTSGSTGKPKGILMPHRAICTSILHHGPAFEAGPHWRTLQFCAHTFDLSIAEFFTTLSFGGTICVPSEEDRTENLTGAIVALQANTLIVVPTVANLLVPSEVAPPLQTVILSGEPIPKESIVRWADHVDLTCAYGPSETAVWCSANLRVHRDAHPAHVGRSIGATMWIVDAEDPGRLAAVGCIGEIAISGALVGGGYFGDKATTDAAFVPAPDWMRDLTGSPAPSLLYRSGDLGRYNPDGTFHVVGRRDTQVKLRGLRIELGEIENRLTHGGLVTAALACLPPSGPAAKRIVAVVTETKSGLDPGAAIQYKSRDESADLVGRLRQHLQRSLPSYMVPSVWIVLDQMPLLISGKIDRKRLKLWVQNMTTDMYNDISQAEENLSTAPDQLPAPVTPDSLMDRIRQLWSDVLQVPVTQIGPNTSFFAAGGDSIAAIQMVSQAKKSLPDIPLSVRAITRANTLGSLVAMLEEKQAGPQKKPARADPISSPSPPLSPPASIALDPLETPEAWNLPDTDAVLLAPYHALLDRVGSYPIQDAHVLSAFQREVLRARNANPSIFLMSWRMELWSSLPGGEPLSLPRLASAWRATVSRFPVLRSVFLKEAPAQLGLPVVQVVLGPEAASEAGILMSEAPSEAPEPVFDDSVLPGVDSSFLPHRAHIIRHGQRVYLHVEMDHLIIDGWSLGLIKKALLEAYDEPDIRQESVTPSYQAFVAAQSTTERIRADNAYWTRLLQGLSPSRLSTTLGSARSAAGPLVRQKKAIVRLPGLPAAGLMPFSAANGITPASIFSAAWAQTLSRFAGTRDVAFEYVVSGRDEELDSAGDRSSVWELVGCCINVLVHRVQVDPSTDLASLAANIQEAGDESASRGASNVREVAKKLANTLPFDTAVNFQRRPTAVENEARTLKVDDDLQRSNDPWHFDVLVRVLHITDDNTFWPSLEFFEEDYNHEAMQAVGEDWWQRVKNVAV